MSVLNAGRKVRASRIVLWEITPKCEKALDIYEGYPHLYIKRDIEVIAGGEPVQAFAYVMQAKYEAMPAMPSRYYFDIISERVTLTTASTQPRYMKR